jgi:hypothetical protein
VTLEPAATAALMRRAQALAVDLSNLVILAGDLNAALTSAEKVADADRYVSRKT